jgi:hypothetical protein
MNIAKAKKMHIVDFLKMNGHSPVRIKYGSAWFFSPMRTEGTPSFKVNMDKNLWFDFGSGEGGDIISLVMKLSSINVRETLEILDKNLYSPRPHNPVHQDRKTSDESGQIKINRLQALNNPGLIKYLGSRNVSLHFAKTYLKEAYYTVHGRRYYALAFENDRGGYELRNAFFKTGSSPKYLTTIPGVNNSKTNVFEGFMDFLSCCTYYRKIPSSRTIVLNSLSFLKKIGPLLSEVEHVNLYLDNDQAGRAATNEIRAQINSVKDWAPIIYPGYKDFNEFLMNRKP